MPHYSSWGAPAQHARLPPTPPEYQAAYLTPMSAASDQGYYSSQSFHTRHASSRDRSDRFHQAPAYAAQQSLSSHAHPRMSHMQSQDYQMQGYPTQVVAAQFPYAPAAAPVLPPLRIGGAIDPFQRYPQQEQKKEEKPTGGVAQHLDYEINVMTLFVAEMTQELVAPGTDPAPTFRKYVAQILSSTRLPSSTILLGLFYMSSRLKLVAESGLVDSSSRNVFQMLTTGLLLGSKFLDDNTFQNRSWAEVSSIPVQDLNKLELAWLEGFNWEIHGLMYDDDEGFFQWVDHWHTYEKKTKAAKVKEMQKLAPIETNLRRSYTVQHPELMSPDGPIPQQYQQTPQYDQQWGRQYMSEYSPPSAPHSGPATPEYYPNQWNYSQTPSAFGRQAWNSGSAYSTQQGLPSFQHTPTYQAYGYSQPAWVGHGPSCACTLCAKHSEYYFNHGGYGIPAIG